MNKENMNITWLGREEINSAVKNRLEDVNIVLDIGCGIRPLKDIRTIVHICCEPFEQYLEQLKKDIRNKFDRNYVIIKATWAEAVKLFPPKSIDTVLLVDVIEHIDKQNAINLLKDSANIARRQIVIFTPLGFMPQCHPDGKDAWGLDGGDWQEHKSGWLPEDFDDTWEIFASKEFHFVDHEGNKFEKPYGAFWAIKSFDGVDKSNSLIEENIRIMRNIAIKHTHNFNFKALIFFMESVKKLKIFIVKIYVQLLKRLKRKE